MASLLEARDLACLRGGRLVFRDIGFALDPGDALVLRGPNGSGKSSLLRLLAGFLAPAGGELCWSGEPVDADRPAHRARVHYVGHAHGLKTALTARENLSFAADLTGGALAALGPALDTFDLGPLAEVPVRLLSAGQRRRLALARLLAAPRPLWLLDEPGVGLDARSRGKLEATIEGHRAKGGLVALATHGDVAARDPLLLDLGP
ncbi:MAG TPA: heme ABC exporter ATP-binding protein CcmA [Geminicoccaceae bacterium]